MWILPMQNIMLSSSYSWICLMVFLSLLASSTSQFNPFRSRTRFQPTISPRFGLNSFGRQRGLDSFSRGVFATTTVDHPVTQTIPSSTLEPGIEKSVSITTSSTKSTRRSSNTVATASPTRTAFGPQSLSSTETAEAYRSSETTRTTKTSSRGSSIFSGLGNIFTTARTKATSIPDKSPTIATEAVTTTVTATRTTSTIRTTSPSSPSPTSPSTASISTSESVTTPGMFTNLLGRFNILTTKEPVDTEAAPSPSTPAKFSNLFGRSQSSSEHLVPQTTTRPPAQPVTHEIVGGINSSSTKSSFVITTIGSTRRPSTTAGAVPGSRSLLGELGRMSTEAPVTPSSTESSVTAKTSRRGFSIFSRLAKTQATTGATARSTITRTSSTTSMSKASITTSRSVTTTGVLTNLFNKLIRTTKEPEDLKTVDATTTAPLLAFPGKVSSRFVRPLSTGVNQPTTTSTTTTTQSSREVGKGRRREKEKDAAISESNNSEGILPAIEPSEEMMDKVVDLMENLIFAGSVPASNEQSVKGSSGSSSSSISTSQPINEEVSLIQDKFSLFGNRREKNISEGDSVTTGKIVGGEDVVADEEKVETFAGGEKVERVGEVKVSRKIGNLLGRLNLTGRKQVEETSNTSDNKCDDNLDEEKPVGETSDEIMDIVLESLEKLLLNQDQAGAQDSKRSQGIPTRPSSPLGPTASSSDQNFPRKPNSSFFNRNALKTRLRPLVAAALSSPQSSTPLDDMVSMLRAVLSEELPPHIRDHILSSQFTQHARTLFRHQQTLSVPDVQVTQSATTSQATTARTNTNQETIISTEATTTTEATTVTEATTTNETTVTTQAAGHLKTIIVPSRRVQTLPVQISKQSLNKKLHDIVSPPRIIIKLLSTTTPFTPVDSPRSSFSIPAATEPGSGESLSVNSTEPLHRRIVLLEADSDEQLSMEDSRRTTTQPSVNRRVVQTETGKLFTTPTKQSLRTPATEMSSPVKESFSTSIDEEATLPPLVESQSRRIVLLKSLASRILPELTSEPSTTAEVTSVSTTTTSVSTSTSTVSSTFKSRSRPVESLPRRIVLLKAFSELVKSDLSPPVTKTDLDMLVSNDPIVKNSKSPGLSGVNALPRLVSLANAQSSESSSTLLGQTTSSSSKVTEGTSRTPIVDVSPTLFDTNPRIAKSLSRRIVLLEALSEDLITSNEEASKHIIQKELKALHNPASVSSSKSIQGDEPSTNTPRRPIKPTPPVLPNLMPKAFSIHPAVPNPSTPSVATTKQLTILSPPPTTTPPVSTRVTSKSTNPRVIVSETISPTRLPVIKTTIPLRTSPTPVPKSQPVKLSTPTVSVKSTEDDTHSLTTRLPAEVATPIISLTRRLPRGKVTGKQVFTESSSPAKDVIEIEVDVGGIETKAKASSPTVGKTFFSRTPYREVASFHFLVEGGVELVTVGGRTLARSKSDGRIPVRDSLPAGLTRTLKVTPVFITGVGRGRFF